MNPTCVIVANSSRARFFKLEDSDSPDFETGPKLIELSALINSETSHNASGSWSEMKSGRNRATNSGNAHGYDDHRKKHLDEYEKRFAQSIIDETQRINKRNGKIILVSQNRMLGHLRNAMSGALKESLTTELNKDLIRLDPNELQDRLSDEHLIPKKRSVPH
ncbi:MAG TPA: host attachment protein [Gammaproteobacteria bacterium]|nr:host attachment protein [Gammaproteobacteria bacterium]